MKQLFYVRVIPDAAKIYMNRDTVGKLTKLKQSSWTSGFDSGISCEWPGFNPRGKPLGISGSIVG